MAENLHAKHRSRVKKEFLKHGFQKDTPPHKVLELLLFFCVPRCDTNPLAHELLNRFGSLAGVLNAPVEELVRFSGLTESNVVLFKLIPEVARRYWEDQVDADHAFRNLDDVGEYLCRSHFGFTEEKVSVLCLSSNAKLLAHDFLANGNVSSVGISMRDVAEIALRNDAAAVVLAHNHPSGCALPSPEDVRVTEMVSISLAHVGVRLLDHVVIAADDFVSMAQTPKYRYLFEGNLIK
ncbi:MAG: DNA repair protein RadC [Clostridia bacterium]|nr:DNA repair protein RadC [Clostridia bacterium]